MVKAVEQVTHAIAFQPQRQLNLVRRQSFEVVRAIKIRGAIDVARARGLEITERSADGVLGTFEHHVFEQVRKPGASGPLIGRADVIPQIHRHHGQASVA